MTTKVRGVTTNLLWGLTALLWVGVGYVALAGYALELGAVHHDLFCPEHGAHV